MQWNVRGNLECVGQGAPRRWGTGAWQCALHFVKALLIRLEAEYWHILQTTSISCLHSTLYFVLCSLVQAAEASAA